VTNITENNRKIEVDMYRAAALSETGHGYKGLRIHALSGLHDYTAECIYDHVAVGASVLDLAAGSGAMTQRLIDAGYKVTATDYVSENFRLHSSVPFFQTDLNDQFSRGREATFGAIMASEIIEHLENPRNFTRECFKLLQPGGVLVLSTPNLDNAANIACFLRSETFQWFGDREYKRDGHITPLTQWQIKKCIAEAGFETLEMKSFGDPYGTVRGSPRLLLLSKAINLLSQVDKARAGQIFVGVFRRPA
jgi:2-polyprenyl-3-methyl-5-hydroxy-6-metoxy-1,4-benzoquinol methylase